MGMCPYSLPGPRLLSHPCHPFTRIAATVALPVLRVWRNVILGTSETNSSYAFHPYFQELPHDDVGRVWSKIPLVNHTFSLGDPDWVLWMDFDTLFTNMSFTFEEFVKDVKENYVNLRNTGQKWIDVDMILTADWYTTLFLAPIPVHLYPQNESPRVAGRETTPSFQISVLPIPSPVLFHSIHFKFPSFLFRSLTCSGDFNAGIILFRNSAWSRHFLEETWQKRHDDTGSEQDAMKKLLQKANEFEEGNKHMIRVPQWKLNSYPEEISCKEDMKRPWRVGDWIIHFPVSYSVPPSLWFCISCFCCFVGCGQSPSDSVSYFQSCVFISFPLVYWSEFGLVWEWL
jgi:galactosyl transferase GMA12/MNN10 family